MSMKAQLSVLLKRNPLKIPPLTEYEKSFYLYQDEIKQETSRPFIQEFYYKKGSTSEKRYLDAVKEYGRLVQPQEPEFTASLSGDTDTSEGDSSKEVDLTLKNAAQGTDLNRKPSDKLYLLIKNGTKYEFPTTKVSKSLLESCTSLVSSLGKLESFVIGKCPVGHSDNLYYMKSVILSGRVGGEHVWVTRDELKHFNEKLYGEAADLL